MFFQNNHREIDKFGYFDNNFALAFEISEIKLFYN
jgi:hypothetical protein